MCVRCPLLVTLRAGCGHDNRLQLKLLLRVCFTWNRGRVETPRSQPPLSQGRAEQVLPCSIAGRTTSGLAWLRLEALRSLCLRRLRAAATHTQTSVIETSAIPSSSHVKFNTNLSHKTFICF